MSIPRERTKKQEVYESVRERLGDMTIRWTHLCTNVLQHGLPRRLEGLDESSGFIEQIEAGISVAGHIEAASQG